LNGSDIAQHYAGRVDGDHNTIDNGFGTLSAITSHSLDLYLAEVGFFRQNGYDLAQLNGSDGSFDFDRIVLRAYGSGATFSIGTQAETLQGTTGADLILGGALNDTLRGLAGKDQLNGGTGNDVLFGGVGSDVLIGGPGQDRFVFNSGLESPTGAGRDLIRDFVRSQHDQIDLRPIDADQRLTHLLNQAFVFIGADTFAHYHAAHPSIIGMVRMAGGIVQGNFNANLIADFEIKVVGLASMVSHDFLL
jgi:Ca2+-binding RTX toxin-like protein